MDGLQLSRFSFPFLFALSIAVFGCGSPVKSAKSSAPGFTVGNGTASDPENPDPEEQPSESAGFFIKLRAPDTSVEPDQTVLIHRANVDYANGAGVLQTADTTNFSTECRIGTSAALADKDILCVAEIEELDLYFSDLVFQYHVAPSMCSYVSFLPYYFYAYEPGAGPTFVSHEVLADGSINDVLNTSEGEPQCDKDYTSSGGPDCCLGQYTHRITTYASDGTVSTTNEVKDWTGKLSSCMHGPAMGSGWADYRDSRGIPLTKIQYSESVGVNGTLDMGGAIKEKFGSNRSIRSSVWVSNYFDPTQHTTGPGDSGAYDNRRPVAMRIPPSVPTIYRHLPNDVYTVTCLDRAHEVLSRIRVMIREWNTHSISDGGDPDVTSTNPDFPDDYNNDYADWYDFGDVYPASSY